MSSLEIDYHTKKDFPSEHDFDCDRMRLRMDRQYLSPGSPLFQRYIGPYTRHIADTSVIAQHIQLQMPATRPRYFLIDPGTDFESHKQYFHDILPVLGLFRAHDTLVLLKSRDTTNSTPIVFHSIDEFWGFSFRQLNNLTYPSNIDRVFANEPVGREIEIILITPTSSQPGLSSEWTFPDAATIHSVIYCHSVDDHSLGLASIAVTRFPGTLSLFSRTAALAILADNSFLKHQTAVALARNESPELGTCLTYIHASDPRTFADIIQSGVLADVGDAILATAQTMPIATTIRGKTRPLRSPSQHQRTVIAHCILMHLQIHSVTIDFLSTAVSYIACAFRASLTPDFSDYDAVFADVDIDDHSKLSLRNYLHAMAVQMRSQIPPTHATATWTQSENLIIWAHLFNYGFDLSTISPKLDRSKENIRNHIRRTLVKEDIDLLVRSRAHSLFSANIPHEQIAIDLGLGEATIANMYRAYQHRTVSAEIAIAQQRLHSTTPGLFVDTLGVTAKYRAVSESQSLAPQFLTPDQPNAATGESGNDIDVQTAEGAENNMGEDESNETTVLTADGGENNQIETDNGAGDASSDTSDEEETQMEQPNVPERAVSKYALTPEAKEVINIVKGDKHLNDAINAFVAQHPTEAPRELADHLITAFLTSKPLNDAAREGVAGAIGSFELHGEVYLVAFFAKHVLEVKRRENTADTTRRKRLKYCVKLWPLYLLHRLDGRLAYDKLVKFWRFPSMSSADRHLAAMYKQLNMADFSIFDGELAHITQILDMYWSDETLDIQGRVAVAPIDAITFEAKISIKVYTVTIGNQTEERVRITGLMDDELPKAMEGMTPDRARILLKDYTEFRKFHKKHVGGAIKNGFVVIIVPTKPNSKIFPVAFIPSQSGKATEVITDKYELILHRIEHYSTGRTVYPAFDGDKGHGGAAKHFGEMIMKLWDDDQIDLNAPIWSLLEKEPPAQRQRPAFPDLFHLQKRSRYRTLNNGGETVEPSDTSPRFRDETVHVFQSWPDENKARISYQTIRKLDCEPATFDNSRGSKQYDDLVVDFFSPRSIMIPVENQTEEFVHLGVMMTPIILLARGVREENLSRSQRGNMFSVAFSMLYSYKHDVRTMAERMKTFRPLAKLVSELCARRVFLDFLALLDANAQKEFKANMKVALKPHKQLNIQAEKLKDFKDKFVLAVQERPIDQQAEFALATFGPRLNMLIENLAENEQMISASQYHTRDTTFVAFYDDVFIDEALLLLHGLIKALEDGDDARLAAFGSHLLEHFFGRCRSIMNGDGSYIKFQRAMRKTVVQDYLYRLLHQDPLNAIRIRTRVGPSDSGVDVAAGPTPIWTFGQSMKVALGIIKMISNGATREHLYTKLDGIKIAPLAIIAGMDGAMPVDQLSVDVPDAMFLNEDRTLELLFTLMPTVVDAERTSINTKALEGSRKNGRKNNFANAYNASVSKDE